MVLILVRIIHPSCFSINGNWLICFRGWMWSYRGGLAGDGLAGEVLGQWLPEAVFRARRATNCCRAGLALDLNAFSVLALFGLTLPVLCPLVDFYRNNVLCGMSRGCC